MRRSQEEIQGPLSVVYIAGNMADAKRAEKVLTDRGVEYALSLEPFTTESPLARFMGAEYMGLFFSVSNAQHRIGCEVLEAEGLVDTVPLSTDSGND
jgi:hypothetical protein